MIMPHNNEMGVENKWGTHWSISWKPLVHRDFWAKRQRMRTIQAFRGIWANEDSNIKLGQLHIPSQLEMCRDHTEKVIHAWASTWFLTLGSGQWQSHSSLLPPDLAPWWVSLHPFLALFMSLSHQHVWVLSHTNPVLSPVWLRNGRNRRDEKSRYSWKDHLISPWRVSMKGLEDHLVSVWPWSGFILMHSFPL